MKVGRLSLRRSFGDLCRIRAHPTSVRLGLGPNLIDRKLGGPEPDTSAL